jgi:predicted transcriptional regulator
MPDTDSETNSVELATELTIAWLSNPNTRVSAEEVPNFLQSMHSAVTNLSSAGSSSEAAAPEQEQFTPAVSARKSLASKDHIISMIDGKPYKSLKRHLARHGLTPAQYRERFGLKSDYPMVSESYSQVRRDMANKIGLGRKRAVSAKGESTKAAGNGEGNGNGNGSAAKARKPRPAKAKPAPEADAQG